jgi:hypothetical protein
LIIALGSMLAATAARADLAGDTTITIVGQDAGPTPFIRKVNLTCSNVDALQQVKFKITPKAGSVTRPISATYSLSYLEGRGYLHRDMGQVTIPVFGLYAGYTNEITLKYTFTDSSTKEDSTTATTDPYTDSCGYDNAQVLLPRTKAPLPYDFILVKSACSTSTPVILDTDGLVRWVGTAGVRSYSHIFFDNALYIGNGPQVLRVELDGTVTLLSDLTGHDIVGLHHNLDPGKTGIIFEADTTTQVESMIGEMDRAGQIIKVWDVAQIISDAMVAGGDDPSAFVKPAPEDWFHSNAATYNGKDDTVIISSRENFVIALDYETGAIKWILGDPTKQWYKFPSLRKFALALGPDTLPPIGQHSLSITSDGNLLLFDNGTPSLNHVPVGDARNYSAIRKYHIDQEKRVATEVFNYDNDRTLKSAFCSAVEEEAGPSYLIDYAYINNLAETQFAELVGLGADGKKVFDYRYPTTLCDQAFSAATIHLERLQYPLVPTLPPSGALANASSRAFVGAGDNVAIGGFIISGTQPRQVVIRGLGPSLTQFGVPGVIPDPILEVHNAHEVIATNDDFVPDQMLADLGLQPENPKESVVSLTLNPGSYTAILRDKDNTPGIALIEVFGLGAAGGQLANLSTRAHVGEGDNVLIGGFIVTAAPSRMAVRALGPSLVAQGVPDALLDPNITVYNAEGAIVAQNDAWRLGRETEVIESGLAPGDDREAVVLETLPIGSYTAIVRNSDANEETDGIGLVEIFKLPNSSPSPTSVSR